MTSPMTAEGLAALPDDGVRRELVDGVLRMMSPAGGRHGRIAARMTVSLGTHVGQHRLGEGFTAETGFVLHRNPDTVRAPDVALVRRERIEPYKELAGYLPLAPDLAVEIVSPADNASDVEEKAMSWLRAGTGMVLVVDPANRTVRVYRDKNHVLILHSDDTLDADLIVPGWRLPIGELFT